ncbi:hypothetical protein GCM10023080_034340 [Streptomyces pseudoechinosporeus]
MTDSWPERLQRLASNSEFTRTQLAYRAYLDHSIACAGCGHGQTRCETAEELWRAYKDAQEKRP